MDAPVFLMQLVVSLEPVLLLELLELGAPIWLLSFSCWESDTSLSVNATLDSSCCGCCCDEDGDVLAPELLLCPCCDDVLEFTTALMMELVGTRATLFVINLLRGCVLWLRCDQFSGSTGDLLPALLVLIVGECQQILFKASALIWDRTCFICVVNKMVSHARKTMKFYSYKTKGCLCKIHSHKNQNHAKKLYFLGS